MTKTEASRQNGALSRGPKTPAGKIRSSRNRTDHGLSIVAPIVEGLETVKEWELHRAGLLEALAPVGALEELLAERVAALSWRLNRVLRYETSSLRNGLATISGDVAKKLSVLPHLPWDDDPAPEAPGRGLRALEEILSGLEALEAAFSETPDRRIEPLLAVELLERFAREIGENGGDVLDAIAVPGLPSWEEWETFEWTAGLMRGCLEALASSVGLPEPLSLLWRAFGTLSREIEKAKQAEAKRARVERELLADRSLPSERDFERVSRYETHVERSLWRALHELERLQERRTGGAVAAPAVLDVTGSFGENP